MRVVKKFILSFLCCFIFSSIIHATQRGSDFVVSLEPYFDFPSVDADNAMLTFGFFKDGFGLADPLTTCTFFSIFPISGTINLRGGQLSLASDLLIHDAATLRSSGTILGNNHRLDVAPTITGFSASHNTLFKDTHIFLHSDLQISGTMKFKGSCVLDGGWNRVSLIDGSQIIVDRNSTLCLRNVEIDGIKSNRICCLDDAGSIILDNMLWAQDAHVSFTCGSIKFTNNVNFVGPWNFHYSSKMTSTIDEDSTWFLSDLTQIIIGRQRSIYAREPLYLTDITSVMKMNNSTLNVSQYGMRLTRGTFLVDGEVKFDINSTNSSHGLAFGDGTLTGDIALKYSPAAVLNFARGDLIHDTISVGNFVSGNIQKIFLRRGVGTNFWSNFDSNFTNVSLVFGLGGISFLAPGKHGYFTNCDARIGPLEFSLTATRITDATFGLYNGGAIRVNVGTFQAPLGIVARGTGNVLQCAADAGGIITINDGVSQLNVGIVGDAFSNITMNGGTINLTRDLSCIQGLSLTGTGNVNLSKHNLTLGVGGWTWTSTTKFIGNGGGIVLKSGLDLTSTVTFSGIVQIDGGDNTINLSHRGAICIAKNSILTLKRIRFTGIQGSNIYCADNTSKIVFDDIDMVLDDNFSFTVGSFKVNNSCKIVGNSRAFIYQSSQTSTIHSVATMLFDVGTTFSYDPVNSRSSNIRFEDDLARMAFSNSNLYATRWGMQFLRGTVSISGMCNWYVDFANLFDGTVSSTMGIIFGNNDSSYDCIVKVRSGGQLNMRNGNVIYRNVQANSLYMESVNSFISMYPGTALILDQTLSLGNGTLQLSSSAPYQIAEGMMIDGSVNIF